ncbi:MAG: ATP phosphoribosyltransferase regulatory subunit [Alphaproteobacteria bacterium]|nr:MAG: ATP phosphoribosyltransferase regulatory subunit [Alphaproteobacteria bacterium]
MPENRAKALLPEGLRDDLPPWAEHEAHLVDCLMAIFAAHGYERVAPPLVEFEESLLAPAGAASATSMFRLLDPVSQRMMALRSDMTPQVARIAQTRLASRARPLRLSYAGHVLRVKGTQLRPARQFRQAGVELIGTDCLEADLEIIGLATEALTALGVRGLSVDLVSPTLVPAIAARLGLDREAAAAARSALDAKDVGALATFPQEARELLSALMRCAGTVAETADRLAGLPLAGEAAAIRDRYLATARAVAERAPDLMVTLDPGEIRGFEYHNGIGFALFARNVRGELGRGGRYRAKGPEGDGEPAVGFSMYLDSLIRAVPAPQAVRRLYCPFGTGPERAAHLRGEGWRTIAGLAATDDPEGEARRLGCTHILDRDTGQVRALDGQEGS